MRGSTGVAAVVVVAAVLADRLLVTFPGQTRSKGRESHLTRT